jgi:hypothetical protein
MSVLPATRDAVLFIHPDAVPPCLIALQQFQPIPRPHSQVIKTTGRVNQLELALSNTPQILGNPPRRAGVSLAEEINSRFVGE